ncbi:enoyl-CoA hydratase-related protein [Solimonas terrae]|uniref:Enoyl-CoA hydratase n=1 Tax=Solimonas terrae TaxID=1396819 RepID=A0A6M2BPP2_9GAMM|nr:enoyl-CoA hydratase-related protein [Solimonas terrae]NGY04334.1 enoyl-CoA hydratase [Solimonas terrae]
MQDSHYRFERIIVERREGGVVLFTINRPERMNATDDVLHREFALLPRLFDEDEEGTIAIITGAGRAFSAGGDYATIASDDNDYARKLAMTRETLQLVGSLLDCRKPIISAINGPAAGAGLALALLADISIANEDAVLCDGHTRIGLAAGDHAVLIWPLLCGLAKARLHLLTCRRIKGREAERIGLVSEAVPPADVLPRAFEIAAELAALPPLGIEFTKRSLNLWLCQAMPAFEASLGYELLTSFNPQLQARVGQVAGGAAR